MSERRTGAWVVRHRKKTGPPFYVCRVSGRYVWLDGPVNAFVWPTKKAALDALKDVRDWRKRLYVERSMAHEQHYQAEWDRLRSTVSNGPTLDNALRRNDMKIDPLATAERAIVRALRDADLGTQTQVTFADRFEIATDDLIIRVERNPDTEFLRDLRVHNKPTPAAHDRTKNTRPFCPECDLGVNACTCDLNAR